MCIPLTLLLPEHGALVLTDLRELCKKVGKNGITWCNERRTFKNSEVLSGLYQIFRGIAIPTSKGRPVMTSAVTVCYIKDFQHL